MTSGRAVVGVASGVMLVITTACGGTAPLMTDPEWTTTSGGELVEELPADTIVEFEAAAYGTCDSVRIEYRLGSNRLRFRCDGDMPEHGVSCGDDVVVDRYPAAGESEEVWEVRRALTVDIGSHGEEPGSEVVVVSECCEWKEEDEDEEECATKRDRLAFRIAETDD